MKKMKRLISQILAVLLAGTLTMGSMSVSTFGAEGDSSATSEVATEDDAGVSEDAAAETETVATDSADAADAVTSYKVTLDANGGYFANEWDDVLGEYVDRTVIINKVVPVGETVNVVPVIEQVDTVSTFLGWSLERDGEIVWQTQGDAAEQSQEDTAEIQGQEKVTEQGQEGYAPVDNCVLYAVWSYEDAADEVVESDGASEETTSDAETAEVDESVMANESATEGAADDTSVTNEGSADVVSEEPSEEAVITYTITLDANGGYFENEWDDVLGEYVERTELLNKVITVGEAIKIVPVRGLEETSTFLGWSLEPYGELLTQGEYAPLDSCTLFAVWETVDETVDNIEDEIQEDDSEEAPVANEIGDDGEHGRTDETDTPATTEDTQEVADENVESGDNPADNTDQQLQEAVEETVTDEVASIVEEEADEEKISTEPMFTGESTSSSHMWYRYNGNIDIRGFANGSIIQTTFSDGGYSTVLQCDGNKETMQFSQNGEAASHSSGLTITPKIDFSADGYYAIVKYTVRNTSITSKTFNLGVHADVDIDSDDYASVYKTNNGLRMVDRVGGRTYYLVCKNITGATSAGTLWFGYYLDRFDNVFNSTNNKELTETDSGLAFSWNNQVISAGGSATYVYQIGIGETGVIEDYNEDHSNLDSDGDGISDEWEKNGADTNGDGIIDINLPEMGANPLVPDIFVEVDWMTGLKPRNTSLKLVFDQFNEHGINLHIDAGSDSIDYVTGKKWGILSGGNSIPYSDIFDLGNNGNDFSNWEATANKFFAQNRRSIFRYCLFVNRYKRGRSSNSSGIANNIPGQFFIVADVNGWISGTDISQAGTFMHELGHTLGLRHGGSDNQNLKPNYLSVMNYLFQTTGLVGTNGVNYSDYVLPEIDENHINEEVGIDPNKATEGTGLGSKWYYYHIHQGSTVLRILLKYLANYDVEGQIEEISGEISGNAIDFNYNSAWETDIQEDLNNDGKITTLSASINDWKNISFCGGEVGSGSSLNGTEIHIQESDNPEDYAELNEDMANELNLLTNNLEYSDKINVPNDSKTIKATQYITVKSTASSIAVGKTATVSITGNKGKKSYKSSNTAIATVNASTGKVTAKKVGTVKITATSAATSNYNAASKTVTLKIVPAATSKITAANQAKGIKVTWKKVTGANGYIIYRNNKKAKTITSGSTVTWTDTAANTNGAKYVYKIVAKASTGNSTLNKSLTTYKVARPTVKTLKNSASKKMTVKWAKNGKATGYQIQYSTSKKFSSGNKTTTVTKAGTVSKTIGSLAAGKTYYVRIRTYKTVGKTKYWSAWSATKNVKIKPLAIVKQGTCGKGVKWKLDSYGKLTFSGSGSIPGYYLNAPWQAKAKSINSIVIGNGIIGIGENTFYDCDTLTSVTIPASVTKIGKDAFAWCNKLTKVKISKSLTNKYAEAFIHTPWFNSIVDKKLAIRIYSRELKGKKGEFCLLYITNDNIPDLIYKSVPYDYTLYINGAYMESVCVGGPGTKLYFAYYPYKNFYKICDDKKYPSYYTVASENGLIGCYECLSAVSYGYYEGYISDYDGGRSFNYNLNKWIADREITKKEFNAIKTKRADGESEKGCKFLKISKSNLAKNGLDAYK